VSSAERRALTLKEERAVPRLSDIYGSLPAITGKIELEYEGELHGSDRIARELISAAANEVFQTRAGGADVEEIVEYFEMGGALQVGADSSAEACIQGFEVVPGLLNLVEHVGLAPKSSSGGCRVGACELVLEALVAEKRISRSTGEGYARARPDPSPGKGYKGFDPFGGINA
jgi:magnesium chelatase subunit I